MTATTKTALIADEIHDGYPIGKCRQAIVDHPTHGRLMIMQGFGGLGQMRGGAYRWDHGAAFQLRPDDTFESLRAEAWNEDTTLFQAVAAGYDDDRPLLEISAYDLNKIAEDVGL